MDVPLSMGAAPCCCGEVFVDEATLSRVGTMSASAIDTGGCTVEAIYCDSDSGLVDGVVCDD